MPRIQAMLVGVWKFVVGDDWRTAVAVVLAVALSALLADAGLAAWWVMPVAVLLILGSSVWREARDTSRR